MQSLADAYNTYTEIDRRSDISHLIDLANTPPRPGPIEKKATAPA